MIEFTYEHVTNAAMAEILALTEESRGKLSEDNQSGWDMANGVVRAWKSIVGPAARTVDEENLQLLVEDMPGYDDEGEGNWHLTQVTHLMPKP